MKSHTVLNKRNFIITVVNDAERPNFPGFLCYSKENQSGVCSSPTEAINTCYEKVFDSNAKFPGPQVMGFDNSNIIQQLLNDLYPPDYEINDREWRAWKAFVRNAGCTNITPFKKGESKFEFWTKAYNPQKDNTTLQILYESGFLQQNPHYSENQSLTFWQAFRDALENTNRGSNGQRRILSIIATKFTYQELKSKLGVAANTVSRAHQYARINGPG
ncbi:unnamed protein product [Rhizophagus irregularis]|nr:unnamed protein product [Rhizophagus irregularis]